jgi:Rod binding domain-containing protein
MHGIQGAGAGAGSAAQGAPQPRLVRAAPEFEAQMMKELMKPLAGGEADEDGDEASGATGALGQFAAESLGKALSEHGGLGIANSIVGSFSHRGTGSGSVKVTEKGHGDTVLRKIQ